LSTLLDLAACQPETALGHVHRQGAWLTVPFRTLDGQTGTALYAGAETSAPPVRLPLQAAGWHHIRVGLWSNWTESTVRLKLSGDRAFHAISRTHADNFAIDDLPWKTADLTHQDIETWIREGLVDRLIAYPWRDQLVDTAAFVDLTRGSGVTFFQDVMPRFMNAAAYQACARILFDAGVDGLCFWDTDQRAPRLSEWCMLRRLSTWASSSDAQPEVRRVPLESVAGMRVDRYPPHWAF
jgi:hypothetical protein